jgi:hypothetical protein
VSLASLRDLSRAGVVRRRAERSAAAEILGAWALRSGSYDAPVASLS